MPTVSEHIAKAEAFERVLAIFDEGNPDHWDWIAVVAFYAALHWVDAYLATQGRHPQNHRERHNALAFLPIRSDYGELYVVSRQARYEGGHIDYHEAIRMRDQLLPIIRQWVQGQLGGVP
ncbi:MAG: hypothetical protein LM632_08815 [Armatimonadetes bacterium]|nr:hypothetical protein [Armatimonadota bacterium]